jgi:hypothetical protein
VIAQGRQNRPDQVRPRGLVGPPEIAQLAGDAGFEAVELRRHTRGDMRFSFVVGTGAKENGLQTEAVLRERR